MSSYQRPASKAQIVARHAVEEDTWLHCDASVSVAFHDTEVDPVFNYGNLTALRYIKMGWGDFIQLPSRQSAEPVNQQVTVSRLVMPLSGRWLMNSVSTETGSWCSRAEVHYQSLID
ncbi:MAG: MEKHLA domain-containing protein [Candidatus Thiodiazotropha sp. LLP2]